MREIKSLIILSFLTVNLYSQETLKVGDVAPKINITDYLLNVPKDKNLANKFIILEFWATWCAPCLSAVPHLNELHENFKDEKDLVFLSLTYEKPAKIEQTLEKIKFKTIVVSDQLKETESNYEVEEFPHTVLIDNKGIVKWIGKPNELNAVLIESFLSGKDVLTNKRELNKAIKEEIETKNNKDIAFEFLNDKETQYLFTLINAKKNDYVMTVEALSRGKYIDLNNNLKSLLSKIIRKPEYQIIVPDVLAENKYNLIYKNAKNVDLETHFNVLKINLLNSINLTENIEVKKVIIYNLKVKNTKKLNISINQNDESRRSEDDTHFVFSNSNIESFIKEIGDYHKIIIFNETGLNEELDFIIKKGNLNELIKDVKEYGLVLEKDTKEIDFYIYK